MEFRRVVRATVVGFPDMNGAGDDPESWREGSVRRRNRLFFLTLGTLGWVFVGAVPAAGWLGRNPGWFAVFWCLGFVLVVVILVLAVQDLLRVRREHGRLNRQLEKELAEVAAETRELARKARHPEPESEEIQ
jgi:hypothetical protein